MVHVGTAALGCPSPKATALSRCYYGTVHLLLEVRHLNIEFPTAALPQRPDGQQRSSPHEPFPPSAMSASLSLPEKFSD